MTTKITLGSEADLLLRDTTFQEGWRSLYEQCPWGTPFQSIDYVTSWYETYRNRYHPVIVSQFSSDGALTGLLTVAVSSDSKQLVVAGTPQSEYQVWLAYPQYGDSFIEKALQNLRMHFPDPSLVFRYLPPLTPTAWLSPGHPYRKYCRIETHSRPVMKLTDSERLSKHLRSRDTKKNLNRLKRLGDVHLEQIKDVAEFASVFDKLTAFYDCRQAAISGIFPFQEDSLKKPFHLALMKSPDLLHVMVLKVDNHVVAAHLGIPFKNMLFPVLIGYNPFYARFSPGSILHFLLGPEFAKQGFEAWDLTPGGDRWKKRLGTDHDEVHIVTIFPGRGKVILLETTEQLTMFIKRILQRFGMTPQAVKRFLSKLRSVTIKKIFSQLARRLWHKSELCMYALNIEDISQMEHSQIMSRDSLEELLLFQPAEPGQTRQNFMSRSLRRIEYGNHVYTYQELGQLFHYGWVIEQPKKFFFPEVEQEFIFPPGTALIFDCYTHPQARGRGLFQSCLRQMLHDLAAIQEIKQVYIAVLSDNMPCRHVIEKIGFIYKCSLFHEITFGKIKQWSSEQDVETVSQEK